ncbi:Neuropeptide Y receptor type 2 [Trichoplax sp. H2]|nr:Neuropeptide Y receptor type 2 [Trichoplax sp. H2]|eukprot:RDD39974.1 Neuropeptide Y receptor type 2 [Trichoplax sp. H2]
MNITPVSNLVSVNDTQGNLSRSDSSNTYYAITTVMITLINVFGMFGNCSIILIIRKKKELHTLPYFQISHLSIASAIFFFTSFIFQIINRHYTSLSKSYQNVSFSTNYNLSENSTYLHNVSNLSVASYTSIPYCQVCVSILLISTNVITFILTLISVGHYRAVISMQKQCMTWRKLYIIISMMWLSATAICLPYTILVISTNTRNKIIICEFSTFENLQSFISAYTYIHVILCFILPCIIICYCYARIMFKLYRQHKNRIEIVSPGRRATSQFHYYDRRQKSIVRTFAITTILYILCVSPYSASFLLITFPKPTVENTDVTSNFTTAGWFSSQTSTNLSLLNRSAIFKVIGKESESGASDGIFFAMGCIFLSILFACMPIMYARSHIKLRKIVLKMVRYPCQVGRTKQLRVAEFRQM